MKDTCRFCGKKKRKNVKNWFIFRGQECCLACKNFLQGEHGVDYLQYRRDQALLFNAKASEVATPDQWLNHIVAASIESKREKISIVPE